MVPSENPWRIQEKEETMLVQRLRRVVEVVEGVLALVGGVALAVCIAMILMVGGSMVHALQPLPTITVVAIFTVFSLGTRESRTMSFGGIVLYALGWLVAWRFGEIAGGWVCGAGFLVWYMAIFPSCSKRPCLTAFSPA